MLSSVAVFAYEGVSTFGLGVTAEVFGCDRKGEGLPRYEYFVTAAQPGVIRTEPWWPGPQPMHRGLRPRRRGAA